MSKTIIAPVGDHMDSLYAGIREFPTEKVILIAPAERHGQAEKVMAELKRLNVPARMREIDGFLWESMFREIGAIAKEERGDIMIDVSTGDVETGCAATSAAFVNGLKAFAVKDNHPFMLPTLKFSYYRMISERKMMILRAIYDDKSCCSSLDELGKKTKMSLPLVSYHINGTQKEDGLRKMDLVDVEEVKGKMKVSLTFLGRMIIEGHIR